MAGPLVPHVGFEVSELSLGEEPSMYTGRMTSPSTEAREAEVTRSSAQLQAVKNEASAEQFGSFLAPRLGASRFTPRGRQYRRAADVHTDRATRPAVLSTQNT